jgi:hypothetical protein
LGMAVSVVSVIDETPKITKLDWLVGISVI